MRTYFTTPTLVAAAAIALLLAAALARLDLTRLAARLRETPAKRRLALSLALLLTAEWALTGINNEGSIGKVTSGLLDSIPYWLDETFAILNGHAPLATFHAQYAHVWPYLSAATMSVFGASYGVFAVTMESGAVLGVLAVFLLLRRLVGNSLLALALFAPFVAHGFFMESGSLANRYGPSNVFSLFPMRYAGPYLLAWLTARHLDGARPGRLLLLTAAGLVLIDNVEFGLPALAATVVALLLAAAPTRAAVARLLAQTAVGVGCAAASVSALTLVAAGTLPRPALLVEFARVFGIDGFGMMPMPTLGLHLAVYATFAATLVVAGVRALAGAQQRTLTAMLAWSGVFGLGAGAYFAGRSHPDVLIDLFSAWALALVLLVIVVVRAVAARPRRRPTAIELAVLFGLGLAVCSMAQTPTPWSQLSRLRETTTVPTFRPLRAERFIARTVRPGERILVIGSLGHRIAYDLHVTDVRPYADTQSMPQRSQFYEMIRVARREGVHSVFFELDRIGADQSAYLFSHGFSLVAVDYRARVAQLSVDAVR